jgi:hypothetical protein
MFGAFAETLARSRNLCRAAAPAGLRFFQHMPWLVDGVSCLEVTLWNANGVLASVLAGAVSPSGERILLRGRFENGALRCTLDSAPAEGDIVGRILALAAQSAPSAVGRFSRRL